MERPDGEKGGCEIVEVRFAASAIKLLAFFPCFLLLMHKMVNADAYLNFYPYIPPIAFSVLRPRLTIPAEPSCIATSMVVLSSGIISGIRLEI